MVDRSERRSFLKLISMNIIQANKKILECESKNDLKGVHYWNSIRLMILERYFGGKKR